MESSHLLTEPSPWVRRWSALLPERGRVLDVACGHGRNARFLAARGLQVDAVDRDARVLDTLTGVPGVRPLACDLEDGGPWPYPPGQFQGVVVTNYLHRPLFPRLIDALAPAGVLIYETFARGNEEFGRPSNPHFLLEPGELLELVRGRLRVVAFEEGYTGSPKPAVVQRLCAVDRSARSYFPLP